ncbi:sentrin-specific protease isoform X2 [Aethina tumida]|uniref:sentrin-specific protease isoform X2 n=1 Tax=Aethina tumida TaxID=116153 RepID=UPI00096B3581|nr:sentrin-specific protease isoform X2 [Aethina tumida]
MFFSVTNMYYSIKDYIRSFFSNALEAPRKRRANDTPDYEIVPKCRRLTSTMSRSNLHDNWSINRRLRNRLSGTRLNQPNLIETITLDDEDNGRTFQKASSNRSKFTSSTPQESRTKLTYSNGVDDEVLFVREDKSPNEKHEMAKKAGLNFVSTSDLFNVKPSTSARNGINPRLSNSKRNSSSSIDASIRLDDKMTYKRLLDTVINNSSNSSLYYTPQGEYFNSSNQRTNRIMGMAQQNCDKKNDSSSSNKKMSTKATIIKVLDDYEGDSVLIRDSDSDSSVTECRPPSPLPDIKVEPVNSLKVELDSNEHTKSDWLSSVIARHKSQSELRQREIDQLKQASSSYEAINRDIRRLRISHNINESLLLKEAVLPIYVEDDGLPVLTEEQSDLAKRSLVGDPNEVLAAKFNLQITRRDIQTLSGLNWLNDEVINFYMNLIIERSKCSTRWPKTYAMNTFFYTKISKDGPGSVRRWTKKVDLFSYDLMCIPIHLGMHWCMAAVDFRVKAIKYYDSMGSNNNRCLNALRSYLECEHMDKKKTALDTSVYTLENVKGIPQQMNGSDCGMFSCTFAEFLSRDAKFEFTQEDMPYLRQKMIVEILTGGLLVK